MNICYNPNKYVVRAIILGLQHIFLYVRLQKPQRSLTMPQKAGLLEYLAQKAPEQSAEHAKATLFHSLAP